MGNRVSSAPKSRESTGGLSEKNKKSKEPSEDSKPRPHAKQTKSGGTTNPFIIFFLRLRSKKSHIPVTKIAKIAGKRWSLMTDEQRKKYVDLANAEKKRREEMKRKRSTYNTKVKSKTKSVSRRSIIEK